MDCTTGSRANSQYGIPGSSIGRNASLRGAATSAWINDRIFAIPPNVPGRRPSSINSEPVRRSWKNKSDNQSAHSEKQLKSSSKPPSIPTTILEQSDRSKARSNESEAPPSRSSSAEPMPSKKANRCQAEKQRHHGATRIEEEEDFDFQEGLYDDARENRNTNSSNPPVSSDPPVVSEASKYLRLYLNLCNEYECDVNDIPGDILDYAHVKATRTYERTLSDALEKCVRAGIASKKVPTAQDKFLDNAREKLKRYKNENTFEGTSGYNAAGINSHSQFAHNDFRVIKGSDDSGCKPVKPKSE